MLCAALLLFSPFSADSLKVDVKKPTIRVSPSLFGAFFEEINNAGEGGLYAELLRNRGMVAVTGRFLDGWEYSGSTFDQSAKLSPASSGSFRLTAGRSTPNWVGNRGFWGFPPGRPQLNVRVWAKGDGTLLLSLKGAKATFEVKGDWKEYRSTLTIPGTLTQGLDTAYFTPQKGDIYLGYASVMPSSTWKNHGLRLDLAQQLNAMRPAFLRFPGGCYVEGNDLANCFDWRNTIQPIQKRASTPKTFWGYTSSNGLGYHEYLQLCEDLGAEAMFVANCGMSHTEITPMDQMDRHVGDILDAIEYAIGPVTTSMGQKRAKNGHPKPFGLKYLEIGNENGYDWAFGGPKPYHERFALIAKAVKDKYPGIRVISNVPVPSPTDLVSEHYYNAPAWFWRNKDRYDRYRRRGPKIYVGEYAVTQGNGRGSLVGALAEAAFMTGMEKNSDIVSMASYAPLFENIKNRQWNPNAIVFDKDRCYGTPSYWVQRMFAENRVDTILASSLSATAAEPPPIVGRFGFKTWHTAADFKDVHLSINGKTVYEAAGPAMTDFDQIVGKWSVSDGLLHGEDLGDDHTAVIRGITAGAKDDWVFEFSARANSGREGFMAMAGVTGPRQEVQWNLGGWTNTEHAFQRNGERIGHPVRGRIEHGKWIRVRLEKKAGVVCGYLDGVLVEKLVEEPAPDLACSVGSAKKEIVLKIVNGSDMTRRIALEGLPSGRFPAVVLTAPRLSAENSLAQPLAVAPKATKVSLERHWMDVQPRSLTIVRLPRP